MTIHVKATSTGFYDCNRIREGQLFTIRHIDDLGEWMEQQKSQGTAKQSEPKKFGNKTKDVK